MLARPHSLGSRSPDSRPSVLLSEPEGKSTQGYLDGPSRSQSRGSIICLPSPLQFINSGITGQEGRITKPGMSLDILLTVWKASLASFLPTRQ